MKTCGELRSGGTVAVVGAGPAGATIANLLHQRGLTVRVFERDSAIDSRPQGGAASTCGRSRASAPSMRLASAVSLPVCRVTMPGRSA